MISPALTDEKRQNQTRRLLVKEVIVVKRGKIAQTAALDLDAEIDGRMNMLTFSHQRRKIMINII